MCFCNSLEDYMAWWCINASVLMNAFNTTASITLGPCRFEVDRYGQICATTLSRFQVCMVKLHHFTW